MAENCSLMLYNDFEKKTIISQFPDFYIRFEDLDYYTHIVHKSHKKDSYSRSISYYINELGMPTKKDLETLCEEILYCSSTADLNNNTEQYYNV